MKTLILLLPAAAWAQERGEPARPKMTDRPPIFFREDWKETPAELPITPAHVANPDLVKSHHDKPADDPYYVWSGECRGNWAVSLRHKTALVDLRGQARIRVRSNQQGFRQLRIVIQLADGAWLVGDQFEGPTRDWRVAEGAWVDNPDLSRVREIGFTDLMAGGASAACSRVDWIEVYGKRVEPGS